MPRSKASARRLRSLRGLLLAALGLSALACGPDDCQGFGQCEAHTLLVPPQSGMAFAPHSTVDTSGRRLESALSARCTLRLDGRLGECVIVKSRPELDGAVLAALAEFQYQPATFSGRPVELQYLFNFDVRLQ